ncbi:MAG: Hint domain-containing protein [Pseudomonadota bacterium]
MFMSPRRAFNGCEAIVTGMFERPSRAGHLPFGFADDTRVETPSGLERIDHLSEGAPVCGVDGRPLPVLRMMRRSYGAEIAQVYPEGLILVPRGTLGLSCDVYLTPDQPVCLTVPRVDGAEGIAMAQVRARSLVGHGAIQTVLPVDGFAITRPVFAHGARVRIEAGLTLYCPAVRERPQVLSDLAAQRYLGGLIPEAGAYPATHKLPMVA